MVNEPLHSAEELIPEVDELRELVESHHYRAAVSRISGIPSQDLAELFSELPEKDRNEAGNRHQHGKILKKSAFCHRMKNFFVSTS